MKMGPRRIEECGLGSQAKTAVLLMSYSIELR